MKMCYNQIQGVQTMKKSTLTATFRNLNNIKRELTLKHPELFENTALVKSIFELELHLRSIQTEAHKANIVEVDE